MNRLVTLIAYLLVVAMWLAFAYSMRDTDLAGRILGFGFAGVCVLGLLAFSADKPRRYPSSREAGDDDA